LGRRGWNSCRFERQYNTATPNTAFFEIAPGAVPGALQLGPGEAEHITRMLGTNRAVTVTLHGRITDLNPNYERNFRSGWGVAYTATDVTIKAGLTTIYHWQGAWHAPGRSEAGEFSSGGGTRSDAHNSRGSAERGDFRGDAAPAVPRFSVQNGWVDHVSGNDVIHVRVALQPATTTVFRSQDFRFAYVPGAENGVSRGLDRAAPKYMKLGHVDASGNLAPVPEVDPNEDLGALGALQVGGGAARTVVVSFAVPTNSFSGEDFAARVSWRP
jgi:hypothetical protein